MKGIQAFFLRAKHWQVFLLFFVLWLVGEFVGSIYASIWVTSEGVTANAALLLSLLSVAPLYASILVWFWSMGSFLAGLVRPSLRPSINLFWFSLIYPCFYLVAFAELAQIAKQSWVILILPFHFFAMFCMIYNLYFVSKSLVMAETGKKANFYHYSVPFFLIWFFPIGIWFTQPRINQLYARRGDSAATPEPAAG